MACRQWMQADAIRFRVTGRGAQGLLAQAAGQLRRQLQRQSLQQGIQALELLNNRVDGFLVFHVSLTSTPILSYLSANYEEKFLR